MRTGNTMLTESEMDLSDDNLMELLDWRPGAPVWRSEWMALYERSPEGGWRTPSPEWLDWARGILAKPADQYGQDAIARLLFLAEPLHPQGMERRRLQDALLALGHLHSRDYQPAEGLVDMAERNGVIRMERVDLWRPGMASGAGWRTFCRLTLYGKSLVEAEAMPEIFPPRQPEARLWHRSSEPASGDWFKRQTALLAKDAAASKAEPPPPGETCAVPEDFSWTAPFVDQQVRKFFRKHRDEYTDAIKAVIDEQVAMEQFALDFGPKRISGWINQLLRVPDERRNRCSKQNINTSATYGVLVKAFKRNPREHAVVQRIQQGRSDEAQAILDKFLSDEGCGS